MDVVPTVRRLRGTQLLRKGGTVLADAVASATADIAAQQALAGALTDYQNAITTQLEDNIEESHKLGHPPPLLDKP